MTRDLNYYRRLQLLLGLSLVIGATSSSWLPAADAAPHAGRAAKPIKTQRNPFQELKGLEARFFVHDYDKDSPERRLQRLESLVFGGYQTGTNEERLDRLKDAISKHDSENAKTLNEKNKQITRAAPATEEDNAPSKASMPTSSQQFPVLDTLEWRVLKKTYQKESLDQRLERLETTLLGQPALALSYADRVERLKKIVGIDIPQSNPYLSMPMPKSQVGPTSPFLPRQQRSMIPRNAYPLGSPFGSPLSRRNSKERTVDEDFQLRSTQDLATMMKFMNQFMDPDFMGSPGFSSPHGFSSPPIIIPIQPQQRMPVKEKETIPPYEDPNSI
jgi:hypothetical protein